MRCLRASAAVLLLLGVSSTDGFQHQLTARSPTDRRLVGPATRRRGTTPQQQQQRSRIRVSLTHSQSNHHGHGPARRTRTSPIISSLWLASSSSSSSAASLTNTSADYYTSERSKRKLAFAMAFLTGFSDVALTLQFQTFATMLTGCLLWFSRSIAEYNGNSLTVVYYASVFLSYLTGVALVRRLRRWPPRRILRTVGTVVATLFITADILVYLCQWSRFVPVSLLAIAYGMINSIGTDFAGTLTFVVTGHMTKLTHMLTDRVLEGRQWTANERQTAKASLSVLGGFTAGAVSAFYLHAQQQCLLQAGVFSMLGISYAALFASYDGKRIRRWWKRRFFPDMQIRRPLVWEQWTHTRSKAREILAWALQDAQKSRHPLVVRTVAGAAGSSSRSNATTTATLIAEAVDEAMANDQDVVLVQTYLPNSKDDDDEFDGENAAADINNGRDDIVVVVVQNNSTIPTPTNYSLATSSVTTRNTSTVTAESSTSESL